MKKGKVQIGIGMVMVTLGLLCLSACSGGNEESGTGETGQKKESSADVGQFSDIDGTSWQDSWTEKTASGMSVNIDMNAYITIPDIARMSAVEVERYEFSEANKRAMLEGIFEGEVYRKRASKDYVKIEGNEYKGNEYLGERDGIRYQFTYQTGDEDTGYGSEECAFIDMEAYDKDDVAPDSLKGCAYLGAERTGLENQVQNRCKMSKEDAEEEAKDFVRKAGFPDLIKTEEGVLMWIGTKESGDTVEPVMDGWHFTWSPGVEGAAFTDSGFESSGFSVNGEEKKYGKYSMDCSVHVYVTDQGVVEAKWNNPIQIISSVPGVKLLPFATIQDTVRNQMTEFAEYCYKKKDKKTIRFDRMELVYCRVSDPDSEKKFSYVPAWRLRNSSGVEETVFLVNAMDGSLIREWDVVWGELKMW